MPAPALLFAALEEQLFHVACVHLAPATLVLEQLLAYFAEGHPARTSDATVYLLQRLGPLQELPFYHPKPSPVPSFPLYWLLAVSATYWANFFALTISAT